MTIILSSYGSVGARASRCPWEGTELPPRWVLGDTAESRDAQSQILPRRGRVDAKSLFAKEARCGASRAAQLRFLNESCGSRRSSET